MEKLVEITREEAIEAARKKHAAIEELEAKRKADLLIVSTSDLYDIQDTIFKYFGIRYSGLLDYSAGAKRVEKPFPYKKMIEFKFDGFTFRLKTDSFFSGYEYPAATYIKRNKPLFWIFKWVRPHDVKGFLKLVDKGII
jgi:hypothetical protein